MNTDAPSVTRTTSDKRRMDEDRCSQLFIFIQQKHFVLIAISFSFISITKSVSTSFISSPRSSSSSLPFVQLSFSSVCPFVSYPSASFLLLSFPFPLLFLSHALSAHLRLRFNPLFMVLPPQPFQIHKPPLRYSASICFSNPDFINDGLSSSALVFLLRIARQVAHLWQDGAGRNVNGVHEAGKFSRKSKLQRLCCH